MVFYLFTLKVKKKKVGVTTVVQWDGLWLWHRLQLWLGSNPWPGKSICCGAVKEKKKKKKKKKKGAPVVAQ